MRGDGSFPSRSRACATRSPTSGAKPRSSRRAHARRSRRAPSATPRTARRSSGRSSGRYGFADAPAHRRRGGRDDAQRHRAAEPGTVVVDVGGGSTELITDEFRTSIDVGCVRLTERHGEDVDAMAAEVRAALPHVDAERSLNVDGTTAELAALAGSRTVTLAGDRPGPRLAPRRRRGGAARAADRARPEATSSRPGSSSSARRSATSASARRPPPTATC